jgi:hypothetical protein
MILDRLVRWFHRSVPVDHAPSSAVLAAERAVLESRRQADRDLAEQRLGLAEAEEVRTTLRKHNEANHYAAWLVRQGITPRGT